MLQVLKATEGNLKIALYMNSRSRAASFVSRMT